MRQALAVFGLAIAIGGSFGCSAAGREGDDDEAAEAVTAADAHAVLEIVPLDIWAQPIPADELKVTVSRNGKVVARGDGPLDVFVRSAGAYTVHAEAVNHVPLDLTVDYDGGTRTDDATVDPSAAKGHGVSLAHTQKSFSHRKLTTHALYLGLRHKWFSAEGRPARRGNDVKLLMDGEEAWSTVRSDLVRARKQVLASTWWWESDFELVRPKTVGASSDERWRNTILGTLESIPATKRVLIGEFFGQGGLRGISDWFTTDGQIRSVASKANDRFEVMMQGNDTMGRFRFDVPSFTFGPRVVRADREAPQPFDLDAEVESTVPGHDVDLTQMPFHLGAVDMASIHQKFMVVDDDVAFVGGMNLRHVDWDSSQHLVYDARREQFGAWDITRSAVADKYKKPDAGPRKDYMVRVEGPSAEDVADVFHERWKMLLDKGMKYSDAASDFQVARGLEPRAGGVQLQVTATMPKPFSEHAIAETWFNAVRNAEKYIYVEDQYFRVPMLNDAIAQRMDERPDLQLVVVTKDIGTWLPECVQTYRTNDFFKRRFPGRYTTYKLASYDADTHEFVDIDVHSKMLVVDDFFMSVGSANKNNRGLVYEAELNVAVADPVVGQWRQRIAQNMLGARIDVSDTGAWLDALRDAAKRNAAAQRVKGQGQTPQGFVYPLEFGAPSTCKMQTVGPDET